MVNKYYFFSFIILNQSQGIHSFTIHRKSESKDTPLMQYAFHRGFTTVGLDDPFYHRQPQPGALPLFGTAGGIDLIKTVPNLIQLILRNADPVILDSSPNQSLFF